MTTDLWMLVCTAVLSISVPLLYGAGRLQASGGGKWLAGNRDTALDVAPWVERAKRAHLNLIENIAPFAVLVLVAHVTGKANEATACGAQLFFYGRLAHVAVYTMGLVYVRTIVFGVTVLGEIWILRALF